MSKISTIYDKLRTEIPLLSGFSTKCELDNVYSLEKNNEAELCDGWGVKLLAASQPFNKSQYKSIMTSRRIEIVLTREVITDDDDSTDIILQSKNIMDDALLLIQDIEDVDTLTIPELERGTYLSDTGIQFLGSNEFKFMSIGVQFSLEYSEDRT